MRHHEHVSSKVFKEEINELIFEGQYAAIELKNAYANHFQRNQGNLSIDAQNAFNKI